jgi:hypothetical protein
MWFFFSLNTTFSGKNLFASQILRECSQTLEGFLSLPISLPSLFHAFSDAVRQFFFGSFGGTQLNKGWEPLV